MMSSYRQILTRLRGFDKRNEQARLKVRDRLVASFHSSPRLRQWRQYCSKLADPQNGTAAEDVYNSQIDFSRVAEWGYCRIMGSQQFQDLHCDDIHWTKGDCYESEPVKLDKNKFEREKNICE